MRLVLYHAYSVARKPLQQINIFFPFALASSAILLYHIMMKSIIMYLWIITPQSRTVRLIPKGARLI